MSDVLFHYRSGVKIGEVQRYIITYNLYEGSNIPDDICLDSLWLRIRNCEPLSKRMAYLMGPFILYCDIRLQEYTHHKKIVSSLDLPKFEPTLQAQQSSLVELSLHNIRPRYTWIVDVVSQALFTTNTQTSFEITLSNDKNLLANNNNISLNSDPIPRNPKVTVQRLLTQDIWNYSLLSVPTIEKKPKHLVVLTHGLHSNVTADMSYLMEQIYNSQSKDSPEILIVKGFTENVCQTERGIKYLGTRVAKCVVENWYDESVTKISFIGHSLGGLVQTFALAYIGVVYPWFFKKVEPMNFITIASPWLGCVTDNPHYVNMALSFGVIGRTGIDLSLEDEGKSGMPLLYLLSGDHTKSILQKFRRRTIYANAINDGIVPLYTSAMLFVDYDDILHNLEEMTNKIFDIDDIENKTNNEIDNMLERSQSSSPISKVLSLIVPQGSSRKKTPMTSIPKASVFESAARIFLPPLPETNFISDPLARPSVIVHDRIYTFLDIPENDPMESSQNPLLHAFTIASGKEKAQVIEREIAKRWHDNLTWRKVIVALKPDAHNNILVRRRFGNAYGWGAIDHLIENHFGDFDSSEDYNETDGETNCIEQEAINITDEEYSWLTRPDERSMFDEGPTGMISTIGDILETMTKGSTLFRTEDQQTSSNDEEVSSRRSSLQELDSDQNVVNWADLSF